MAPESPHMSRRPVPRHVRHQPEYVYAIRYDTGLIHDPSWVCVADVIGSFADGSYTDAAGRVTGVLVRAVRGTDEWVDVA